MIALPRPAEIALFLDVDGTLIDIAERPTDVVVPAVLIEALRALDTILSGALALISGRTIDNLDALFEPLRLRASGVHGAETRFEHGGPVEASSGLMLPEGLVGDIRERLRDQRDLLIEDKAYSVAVHYRATPSARSRIRSILDDMLAMRPELGLRILPGHMVFELKRASFDKGGAIDRFMRRAPFAGRMPLFIGDDVTDLPGFAAVLGNGGRAYSVGATDAAVSGTFPDPDAVRKWLTAIAASETTEV